MAANISIQETNVTTSAKEWVVDLYISDAERESESAKTVLQLHVSLPVGQKGKLLASIQREALRTVEEHVSQIRQNLAKEIEASRHSLNETW